MIDKISFKQKVEKENSTLAIDFDGVIHKNSKGFHDGTIYDEPISGAKEALKFLSKKFTLIIYTCKTTPERPLVNGKTGTELIWEWLKKYDMDKYISEITGIKPIALFYVDDKAIRFNNWEDTINEINGNKDYVETN